MVVAQDRAVRVVGLFDIELSGGQGLEQVAIRALRVLRYVQNLRPVQVHCTIELNGAKITGPNHAR